MTRLCAVGGGFALVGLLMVILGIKMFFATRLPETIVEVDKMPVRVDHPLVPAGLPGVASHRKRNDAADDGETDTDGRGAASLSRSGHLTFETDGRSST